MNKGITVAGNIIVDLIKTIPDYPEKLSLVSINHMERALGGAVSNVAIALSKLDSNLKIRAIGYLGQDENGDYAQAVLDQFENIDTSCVYRCGSTSFTDVMTIGKTGERTFFTYKGADSKLSFEDFDFEKMDAYILHFGYILLLDGMDRHDEQYGTVLAKTLHAAQARGILTSIDVVSEAGNRFAELVTPSLKFADYCTINEYEAQKITGIKLSGSDRKLIEKNMEEACRLIKSQGVSRWVTIHSPECAYGIDENGFFSKAYSLELPEGYIKGSVGAGDAFVSGVLLEAMRGSSQALAMQMGNAAAAMSLSQPGATEGIGTFEDALRILQVMPCRSF